MIIYRKSALSILVERRVGKEKLVEFLESVSHSEHYVRAAQRPQPFAKIPQDLFLDYHFTKFFKSVEGMFWPNKTFTYDIDFCCTLLLSIFIRISKLFRAVNQTNLSICGDTNCEPQ